MKYNEIIGLMQEMTKAGLSKILIEKEDFKLILEKDGVKTSEPDLASDVKEVRPNINDAKSAEIKPLDSQKEITEEKTDNKDSKDIDQYKKIVAPMVGTFYAKPAPDKPPYVQVGDKVKKGQIVCIIEAMKLMNEIESDVDGEIVECLVENEQMVEYGQPLFLVK